MPKRFAIVPFLLLVIPIAEIAAFIAVGGAIGIGWTLLMILVTAIIGTVLLRAQGLGLLARAQGEVRAGRVPARELVHGVMLLVAGVLLLTPGFITDTLGFLLFVPPLRDAGWRALRSRITVTSVMGGMGGPGGPFGAPPGARDGRMRREDGTIDLDENEYRRTDAGARASEPEPHSERTPDPFDPIETDRTGTAGRRDG